MEYFIGAKLRIITREQRTQNSESSKNSYTHKRSRNSYIIFLRQRAIHQMTHYWQFTESSPGPLHDQEGMFPFRWWRVDAGWAGISALGGGSMHSADIQCTAVGRTKRERKYFMFKFFMSYHKMWTLFHTALPCACIILGDLLKIFTNVIEKSYLCGGYLKDTV